jgi:predicted deacylase
MKKHVTPLVAPVIGTQRELASYHFGPQDSAQKIYIQASLHADETPAMLTAVLPAPATPLAGSEHFFAPVSGILVHRATLGAAVRAGDPLFDIVDPLTDETTTICSGTDGIFYMRRALCFVSAGAPPGRVSGTRAQHAGVLPSA